MTCAVARTIEAFDYLWRQIPEGAALLSDPSFIPERCIVDMTGLPAEWFQGKKVLDAGCGNGRYSAGFQRLGADLTAIDASAGAVEAARENGVEASRCDVLHAIHGSYDLVWCFGVLHHTGNAPSAFANLASAVRNGGYLFVMVYAYDAPYKDVRAVMEGKDFFDIESALRKTIPAQHVHGWFDAVAPAINEVYTEMTVAEWYLRNGFAAPVRMAGSHNVMIGQKL